MNRYKDVKRFTENGIQIVATADLPDVDEKEPKTEKLKPSKVEI